MTAIDINNFCIERNAFLNQELLKPFLNWLDKKDILEAAKPNFNYTGIKNGNVFTDGIPLAPLTILPDLYKQHPECFVFPDLQEQDRVKAWEPKPGEEIHASQGSDFFSFSTQRFIYTRKNGMHVTENLDYNGTAHEYKFIRPIPKPDPDGELREIIRKIFCDPNYKEADCISQIKSLLAAKGPNVTKEQFEAKWKQLSESRGIAFEVDSAYETFKFFTKNEMK